MPTYKVTDPQTGKTISLTGDSPPTEQELTQIFSQLQRNQPTEQKPQGDLLLGNAVGLAKGLGEGALSVINPMTYVHAAAWLASLPGQAMDAMRDPGAAWQGVKDTVHALNTQTTAEDVGRTVGALATPGLLKSGVSAVSDAMPSAARAGQNFQSVMGAARDIPVNVSGDVADAALRAKELSAVSTVPKPVANFIKVVDNADIQPLTYERARDYASALSRLSSQDYQTMNPVMARQVAQLSASLNKSVVEAAETAGKGAEYKAAMTEYRRAMQIRDAVNGAVEGVKKAVPAATTAGTGYWLTSRLIRLLGG